MTEIAIKDLETLCVKALSKTGLSDDHVRITVEHYLENELSGKSSHGMVRVVEAIQHLNKRGAPKQGIKTVHQHGAIEILEADGHIGCVAAHKAMTTCIENTKKHGLAFIGVRNYFASTGSMAFYVRRFVENGLIALIGCNSVALVAPPKGKERILGTNPLGMGFPSADGNHFIGDIATSAIAYGKIMVMKDEGKKVPDGNLIDKDGNPSNEPEDAFDGAILPLAEYHGFSLALTICLLGGSLLGAKDLKKDIFDSDGFFMVGLDPKAFGQDQIPEHYATTLNQIRNSAPAPGHKNVTIPGDRSRQTLHDTLEKGSVIIASKTLQKLQELSR
jgi:LDH2 family malate/lactate/ureidoglycolate dehydrogenase